MQIKPFISGLAGTELGQTEAAFFKDQQPAGFILFVRNVHNPDQLSRLTDALKEAVGREHVLILIDQEGGRVQRMGPPHWQLRPAMASFGRLYEHDRSRARRALALNMALIAGDLRRVGVTGNCAPVLDLPVAEAHDIIGDRAFAAEPAIVSDLGTVAADALLDAGVLPVMKHIPGHGRALVDSHKHLPQVDMALEELQETDFAPFRSLNHLPLAMTGHVLFSALDEENCATFSGTLVARIIRGLIGFKGLLMSDDLAMGALGGPMEARSSKALDAGLDLVLHCSGLMDEMQAIIGAMEAMPGDRAELLADALQEAGGKPMPECVALSEEYAAMSAGNNELGFSGD